MADKKSVAEPIVWTAKEHVQRDHKGGWYVALIMVAVVLAALAIWFGGWDAWSFVALLVVIVIAIIVYSVRPARDLSYTLDESGVKEGARLYPLDSFKAFGVKNRGRAFSIVLNPKKRFGAAVIIHFPEEKGEEIVDFLGARLPMEDYKEDFIDKISDFLRI